MYRQRSIAVVIPAFNEESAIARAVRAVPDFVDHIVVIDDDSRDRTAVAAAAEAKSSARVEILAHRENRGVGAAIVTGYQRAISCGLDIVAVMAGDGQMDPADLPTLLDPICDGDADYSKGNRFAHPDVWGVMPKTRLLGNLALSLVTKVTSGYRGVFDSQCGYTAATTEVLSRLDLERVFPRYGYPNDLLARLHTVGARVAEVPVRPVYGPSWSSGIKPHMVAYPISFVLLKSWASRVADESGRALLRALPGKTAAGPE